MKYSISDFKSLPAMQMERVVEIDRFGFVVHRYKRAKIKNSLRTQILKELILLANTNASKKKKK